MKGPKGQDVKAKNVWEQTATASERPRIRFRDLEPETFLHAVDALTQDGLAVTFGLTSDGGAFYVAVIADGQVSKSYYDSAESLQNRLRAVVELP